MGSGLCSPGPHSSGMRYLLRLDLLKQPTFYSSNWSDNVRSNSLSLNKAAVAVLWMQTVPIHWANTCHSVCRDPSPLCPALHLRTVIEQLRPLIFSPVSAHLCMTAGLCKWPRRTPNCCPPWPHYLLKDVDNFTRCSGPVASRWTGKLFKASTAGRPNIRTVPTFPLFASLKTKLGSD